jgi:ectoine hydroxylase-related dioxygenase (phytanoyl-CoA dioxygenase family)
VRELSTMMHVQGPDGNSFWKERDKNPPAGILSPTAEVGDAIVFDLRLRHRGGSNFSPYPRPLL